MTNVITLNRDQWDTLVLLKESIAWYKCNNTNGTFTNALETDTKAYKEYLGTYVSSATRR